MFSSDPVIDYLHHEYEQEKWLQSRPECSICGCHIQTDIALRLGDEWICDKCVAVNRRWIDEYD